MPVAKLSREFYQKFGDKLTDELVNCLNTIESSYRAELKDLFEVHFTRFDEKLERRLAETRAELDLKIEQLRGDMRDMKGELIRSNAFFWVPVTLAVIGLYLNS